MVYRKRKAEHTPIHSEEAGVERVESCKVLASYITNKLLWSKHLYPLRRLKRFVMDPRSSKSSRAAPLRES